MDEVHAQTRKPDDRTLPTRGWLQYRRLPPHARALHSRKHAAAQHDFGAKALRHKQNFTDMLA
jgi:hypothetical protein